MPIFARTNSKYARVAELVDALDSKSSSFGSVGSIPTQGTAKKTLKIIDFEGFCFLGCQQFFLQRNKMRKLLLGIVKGQYLNFAEIRLPVLSVVDYGTTIRLGCL